MKVLFVTNIPSPYRVDFFNELGKLCDLTVVFEKLYVNYRDKKWIKRDFENFKAIFISKKNGIKRFLSSIKVFKYLNREFDIIVIGGYSTLTSLIGIPYLKLKKIPFLLNSDGGFIKYNENSIKRFIKKFYISSANYWLSSGKKTNEHLKFYGAKPDKIFIYPFTSIKEKNIIDRLPDKKEKNKLKNKLNIEEDKVIISVGRFIYRKGFDILLKASSFLDKNIGVYIIGGQPTSELFELKKNLNLNNVHFVNFKTKNELREYYLLADLFVFPTRYDIWGLVINEAMSCGLPVITTDHCLAGLELIKDYENGFIIPVENYELLVEKIKLILDNEDLLLKMGENNLKKIKNYTIEKMAVEHYKIFHKILKND